jgi:hypothetical protein
LTAAEDKRRAGAKPPAQVVIVATVVANAWPQKPQEAAALSGFFSRVYTFCATGCMNQPAANGLLTTDLQFRNSDFRHVHCHRY